MGAMTSKKQPLSRSFVVTVSLGVALGAGGCGGQIISNPPLPNCPESTPSYGSSCGAVDGTCMYSDECGSPITATCKAGTWDVQYEGTCNPPPPEECPLDPPWSGTCWDASLTCEYQDACGQWFSFSCNGTTWIAGEPPFSCNPPPPCPGEIPIEGSECFATPGGFPEGCSYLVETACGPTEIFPTCVGDANGYFFWDYGGASCTPMVPDCASYTDPALCEYDTTCRWLEPGCASDPSEIPAPQGCFPIDDCTANSCAMGTTCTQVVENPCWNSLCDGCGAYASICV